MLISIRRSSDYSLYILTILIFNKEQYRIFHINTDDSWELPSPFTRTTVIYPYQQNYSACQYFCHLALRWNWQGKAMEKAVPCTVTCSASRCLQRWRINREFFHVKQVLSRGHTCARQIGKPSTQAVPISVFVLFCLPFINTNSNSCLKDECLLLLPSSNYH